MSFRKKLLTTWHAFRLSQRMVALSVGVTAFFILVISFVSFQLGKAAVISQIEERNTQFSLEIGNEMRSNFTTILTVLRMQNEAMLGCLSSGQVVNRTGLTSLLRSLKENFSYTFGDIRIVGQDRRLLCQLTGESADDIGVEYFDPRTAPGIEEELAPLVSGKRIGISDLRLDDRAKTSSIVLSVPMNQNCFLMAEIDSRYFWTKMDTVQLAGATISVIDRSGLIFASQDGRRVGRQLGDFFGGVTPGEAASLAYQAGGDRILVSCQPVNKMLGWTIILEQSESVALGSILLLGYVTAACALLSMVLITVLMTTLVGRLTKPLENLSAAANRISDTGDLRFDIDTDRLSGEVKTLAESLRQMTTTLKRSHDNLEDLVSERTAELQEATRKAEEASRVKGEFLANMSHEIRTPINAVIGMNYLLKNTGLSEKQADYVAKVEKSAKSLLLIINDILDFSKISSGKLEIESVDFSLRDEISYITDLASQKAREKQLQFSVDIDPSIPDTLQGDPLRLGQVIQNLLNNALKFTMEGSVGFRVSAVDRDGEDIRLRFEVSDTGIGLTREQQDRLFNAFTQANSTTTRKFGGTGLGLSISRRLCELMRGEIGVTSEINQGSTFHFVLPFRQGAVQNLAAAPGGSLPDLDDIRGARILLVEDNELNQQYARELMEGEGFRVSVAENGARALEILEEGGKAFDLILMDLQMPVMDGFQAAQRIRSDPRFTATPVIALTADAMRGVELKTRAAGMNAFVTKPIDPAALFAALVRWIKPRESAAARRADAGRLAGHDLAAFEALSRIPELDVAEGTGRFLGNRRAYLELMRGFAGNQRDFPAKLRAALDADDQVLASRLAHTFKGIAGTIGAAGLCALGSRLDAQLKLANPDPAAVRELAAEIGAGLDGLLGQLDAIDWGAAGASKERLTDQDREELLRGLEELKAALADNDSRARKLKNRLQAFTTPESLPAFERFGEAVDRFQFDEALELIGQLEARI